MGSYLESVSRLSCQGSQDSIGAMSQEIWRSIEIDIERREEAGKNGKKSVDIQSNSMMIIESREMRSRNWPSNPDETQSADQASFTARLVRRIVENLQVEIEDVHVVFQNHASSVGVILQSLSLVTTDHNGNRTFVDRTLGVKDSFLYKMLQINGFWVFTWMKILRLPFQNIHSRWMHIPTYCSPSLSRPSYVSRTTSIVLTFPSTC